MILDLADPAKPREVGRWWMPGQWTAGGETPSWPGRHHRCHHPIRSGNRLYVSYWHGGFVILDIADMVEADARLGPRLEPALHHADPHRDPRPLPAPRAPRAARGRRGRGQARAGPPSFLWLVDISDERRPVPFASFQVEGVDGTPQPEFTGCHQPHRDDHARHARFPWRGSRTGCASSTSPIRTRRARWRTTFPTCPRDARACRATTSSSTTAD